MISLARSEKLDKSGALAARLSPELRRASLVSALFIAALIGLACIPSGNPKKPQFEWIAARFFFSQDLPCLLGLAIVLMALAAAPVPLLRYRLPSVISRRPFSAPVMLAAGVAICGIAGVYLVFAGYPLSRDEFLVGFDAQIFQSGHLIAPVGEEWRAFANALAPRYMLPIPGGLGFASSYLPINAALRAVAGLAGDPNAAAPLLAATAVFATFIVGRRLWPGRPEGALVSTLLVASSPQLLVTSMTGYAMTAHLALNMVWLCFFLRDDRIGHGLAIAIGFLALGIHQVIFHPLFALPFILRLWIGGRRPLALLYVVSYATFCLFWVNYWNVVLPGDQTPAEFSKDVGPLFFIARVLYVVNDFQWAGVAALVKNVLRFVSWQNPILLLLMIVAVNSLRQLKWAPELLGGIIFTLVAMFMLMPYQGHGWGYRYLHGFIGNAALLAGHGWVWLWQRANANEKRAAASLLTACSLIAWLFLLPLHAEAAHSFVMPYARASQAIREAAADAVVVDTSGLAFAEDLVRNDPFLRNRPLVLNLSDLSEDDIGHLCATSTIAIFDYADGRYFGIPAAEPAAQDGDDGRARLRVLMKDHGCQMRPLAQKPRTESS